MASLELTFENEQCAEAISDVRNNSNPANWALFTYHDSQKNVLVLAGRGSGGLAELKSHLTDSKIYYGLYRTEEVIDQSVTVKFVHIVWVGLKTPTMQKAKMSTHKGSVNSLIGQYHIDLNCENDDELTEDTVQSKIKDAAGTAVHVKENPAHSAAQERPQSVGTAKTGSASKPTSSPATKVKAPPASTGALTFENEDAMRHALAAVRSDRDETDWCMFGYDGNTNKLVHVASGRDGIDQLVEHLVEDKVLYALYRTTDTVDNTVAVKFVFIIWCGEKVPITRKARITTHKGEITSFIGQYHVDVNCSNRSEINEDIVNDLVQKASGTKNWTK